MKVKATNPTEMNGQWFFRQYKIYAHDAAAIAKALGISMPCGSLDQAHAISEFANRAKRQGMTINQAIAAYQSSQQPQEPASTQEFTYAGAPTTTELQQLQEQGRSDQLALQKLQGAVEALQDLAAKNEGRQLIYQFLSGQSVPASSQELQLYNLAMQLGSDQACNANRFFFQGPDNRTILDVSAMLASVRQVEISDGLKLLPKLTSEGKLLPPAQQLPQLPSAPPA